MQSDPAARDNNEKSLISKFHCLQEVKGHVLMKYSKVFTVWCSTVSLKLYAMTSGMFVM